jgi:hypothetical protein
MRIIELAIAGPGAAPLGQERAVRRKDLDPVVGGVSHNDSSIAIHRHAARMDELAIALSPTAPLG